MADDKDTKQIEAHVEHGNITSTATALNSDTVGLNDDLLLRMAQDVPDLPDLIRNAKRASDFEHSLSSMDAFRLFPRSILFSMVMSLAIIMEGYDTALLGNFYAYPTFRERFGFKLPDGTYQITSQWQSGLSNGAQIGQIIGLMVAGIAADRFGYRKTILAAMVLMIAFIFILFFAQSIEMLFAGEVLCGLPWGAFQILTTTYAADVSPSVLRPYLTTFVNLCWVIGQFIAIGVLRGLLGRADEWSWRIPFAIQWVWPLPIIVGVIFAPESPWWLVRKGRLEEAKHALRRLTTRKYSAYSVEDSIALMIITNENEKHVNEGVSYLDCFKGTDRRRTEIACCVWMIQVGCGIWFGSNVVYFMQQAGFPSNKAFDFGLGMNGVAFVGTLSSWIAMQRFGRRFLYIGGLMVMLAILLLVGFYWSLSSPTT